MTRPSGRDPPMSTRVAGQDGQPHTWSLRVLRRHCPPQRKPTGATSQLRMELTSHKTQPKRRPATADPGELKCKRSSGRQHWKMEERNSKGGQRDGHTQQQARRSGSRKGSSAESSGEIAIPRPRPTGRGDVHSRARAGLATATKARKRGRRGCGPRMQARRQERRQARRIRRDADAVETEPTAQQHSVDGAALQLMQDTLRQQGELIASLQQQVEVMALQAEANKQGSTQAAHSEACHLDRLLRARLTDGDLKELFLEPHRYPMGGPSGPIYALQYQMKVALLKVSGYNTYISQTIKSDSRSNITAMGTISLGLSGTAI